MANQYPQGYRYCIGKFGDCPYTGQPMQGQEIAKAPGGRWGIASAVLAGAPLIDKVGNLGKRTAAGKVQVQGKVPRWGLKPPSNFPSHMSSRFNQDLLPHVQRSSQNVVYTLADIARLLDRADDESTRIVTQFFARMWERQTAHEQASGHAVVPNFIGFSKRDSYYATEILKRLMQLGCLEDRNGILYATSVIAPPELHAAMSTILWRYMRQLTDVAEAGRQATGQKVLTNPLKTVAELQELADACASGEAISMFTMVRNRPVATIEFMDGRSVKLRGDDAKNFAVVRRESRSRRLGRMVANPWE